MALLYLDSMDHYATADLTEKWAAASGATIAAGAGRRSTAGLRLASSAAEVQSRGFAPADATAIVGVACKVSGLVNAALVQIRSGSTVQCTLAINSTGFAQVWRGTTSGTLLGTASTGAVAANVYFHIEIKAAIHPSAGTAVVRVNGVQVLSLSGVNTAASGTAAWDNLYLWHNFISFTADYDDLYVADGSGAAPWNGLLGDCRVDALVPTGAGAVTQWTPSTGANYAAVDEIPPNDDTDYVTAASTALVDTYALPDAPVAGAVILGVQHTLNAKKTDAGTCSIAAVVRSGGTNYPSAAVALSTAYAYTLVMQGVSPVSGVAWTEAEFNGAEFGVTRVS